MTERTVSSKLSGDIVELLQRRGMSLSDIALMIGATRSFVSRVKSRTRSLTIDHLVALETKLGEPLPLLLLEATPLESVPEHLKPLYRSTARMLGSRSQRTQSAFKKQARVA